MLKLGSHGPEVTQLQGRLRSSSPSLAADGRFGPRTEHAVRHFQRLKGLYPPDGVVGPITAHALDMASARSGLHKPASTPATGSPARSKPSPGAGDPGPLKPTVNPARERATTAPMPAGDARDVASLFTSSQGLQFIVRHEGQKGVSNHLHHPSAASGVTIGPGYDMKDRSQAEVAGVLQRIGVSKDAADKAAQGAGLSGAPAEAFVKANKHVLDLSDQQQANILTRIIGHYESMVKKAITIPLHQYEFDALVSYAYNPGGGWARTTRLVNAHKPHEAMLELSSHVFSGPKQVHSLFVRRAAECKMFYYGEYT